MFEEQDKKINAAASVEDIFKDTDKTREGGLAGRPNLGPPSALQGGKLQPSSLKPSVSEHNE